MSYMPAFSRLLWPSVLTATAVAAFANYGALFARLGVDLPLPAELEAGRLALAAVSCLALAWLLSRLLEVVLTQVIMRTGRRPSRLLHQTIAVLMFLAALVVILSFVFDRSPIGVLTTSGVLVAVVGFALRNVIADIFSGLALSFEGPYHIGDWIEIESGIRGRVVEINWRSTRLETRNQVHMVLPNSVIAAGRLINYSAPRPHYRVQLSIVLDVGVSVEQAKRVLLAGVLTAPNILHAPPPDVRVDGRGEHDISYVVRYWLPSFADEVDCRDAVLSSIDQQLRIAGIAAPYRRQRVILERDGRRPAGSAAESAQALRRIPALARLAREDLEPLAQAVTWQFIPAGERLEMSAIQSDALLIVNEGVVAMRDAEGRDLGVFKAGDMVCSAAVGHAAPSAPGRSLMASAGAVLLEIPMESLRPILARAPALARELKRAAEARRDLHAKRPEPGQPGTRLSLAARQSSMLGKLRALLK